MPVIKLSLLRKYMESRRDFMVFAVVRMGLIASAGLVWEFGRYGGIQVTLLLVIVSFIGAYIWGILMWAFFMKPFMNRLEKRADPDSGKKGTHLF